MKILYVTLIALLLASCRLQVISPQGGNVTWDGGECLEGNVCVIDIDDINFSETFTATAKSGYEFVGWEYILRLNNNPMTPIPLPCKTAQCIVGFDTITDEISGVIVESLEQGFVTPVYRALYIEPEPEPTPPEPTPEPTPPEPVPDNVVFGPSIPDREMNRTRRYDSILKIPANQGIYAEEFTTINSTTSYGQFVLHVSTSYLSYTPTLNFWISTVGGGSPISSECNYTRAKDYSAMTFAQYSLDGYCQLQPNTTYFLNVKNEEESNLVTHIERWVRILRL